MMFGVPTMYHRLAADAERSGQVADALGRARVLVSGSAALPAADHEHIRRVTGQRIVERYGMTETLMNTVVRASGDRRPGYVGPPLDGVGPQDLAIDSLVSRAHDKAVKEVILALNATVDGQTTAHYVTELLHDANVKVTRLAHGVPVGGELDYLDEGTLSAAIKQRTAF